MSIVLGNVQQFAILSGNQSENILEVFGSNNILNGSVGYSLINMNPSSTLILQNGETEDSTINYNNAIIDLNNIISNIGTLDYINFTNTDIGSVSTLIPGNYLFENPVEFLSTLYLNGNGIYVFYLFSGITINNAPTGGYMNLNNGALSNDIYFYSPYDIVFGGNLNNSNLYGNFISDLNITMSTDNYTIDGRFLTSTGNIQINGVQVNNQDVACYIEGTEILMENNKYKLIENINKNDKIMVYGIIKNNTNIELFDQPKKEKIIFLGKVSITNISEKDYPIRLNINSLENDLPFKRLEISPQHRIITNNKFVLAKELINSEDIIKCNSNNFKKSLTYYHLECQNHYIIKANGILSETLLDFNDDFKRNLERIF